MDFELIFYKINSIVRESLVAHYEIAISHRKCAITICVHIVKLVVRRNKKKTKWADSGRFFKCGYFVRRRFFSPVSSFILQKIDMIMKIDWLFGWHTCTMGKCRFVRSIRPAASFALLFMCSSLIIKRHFAEHNNSNNIVIVAPRRILCAQF